MLQLSCLRQAKGNKHQEVTADSPEQVGREHEQALPGQHEQLARCWAHGTSDLSRQTQCLDNKAFSLALMMQPHIDDIWCPVR